MTGHTLHHSRDGCLQRHRAHVSISRRADLAGCSCVRRSPSDLAINKGCHKYREIVPVEDTLRGYKTYPVDIVGNGSISRRHGECRSWGTGCIRVVLQKNSHKHRKGSEQGSRSEEVKSHG
jgi:hypothetical protein